MSASIFAFSAYLRTGQHGNGLWVYGCCKGLSVDSRNVFWSSCVAIHFLKDWSYTFHRSHPFKAAFSDGHWLSAGFTSQMQPTGLNGERKVLLDNKKEYLRPHEHPALFLAKTPVAWVVSTWIEHCRSLPQKGGLCLSFLQEKVWLRQWSFCTSYCKSCIVEAIPSLLVVSMFLAQKHANHQQKLHCVMLMLSYLKRRQLHLVNFAISLLLFGSAGRNTKKSTPSNLTILWAGLAENIVVILAENTKTIPGLSSTTMWFSALCKKDPTRMLLRPGDELHWSHQPTSHQFPSHQPSRVLRRALCRTWPPRLLAPWSRSWWYSTSVELQKCRSIHFCFSSRCVQASHPRISASSNSNVSRCTGLSTDRLTTSQHRDFSVSQSTSGHWSAKTLST